MSVDAIQTRTLRARMLEFAYSRHRNQLSRMDHVALYQLMQDLGFDLGENDVITLLQDLHERRAVSFDEFKDRKTNLTSIYRIMITPHGRDLVERTVTDPGILF